MASNDSGLDTSNDSNDSGLIAPLAMELPNVFERDNHLEVERFVLPQAFPATSSSYDNPTTSKSLSFPFERSRSKYKLNMVGSTSTSDDHHSEVEGFAQPQSLPTADNTPAPARSNSLPSGSHSLKMRRRNKTKFPLRSGYYAYVHILNRRDEGKLRFAASTCNVELLTKLLKSGTDPNGFDEYKRSPLHLAACRGYTVIVTQLLKYGANPNIIDSLGNTPLHLAVISASSNNFNLIVRILLQGGANVHIVDRNGKNPLELAESKLRMMRERLSNPPPETVKIVEDMCILIALILRHFCKQKKDIDDLAALEERLQNLSTDDQVATEADSLLVSVERLSINK